MPKNIISLVAKLKVRNDLLSLLCNAIDFIGLYSASYPLDFYSKNNMKIIGRIFCSI